MKKFFGGTFICLVFCNTLLKAQKSNSQTNQISVVFGLNQPIVTKGFNIEIDYWTKHFVFDYSHGINLQFTGNLVSKEAKAQQISFNIGHSLGVGVGYRITDNFNLRIEPKLHTWQVYYKDQFKTGQGKIANYTTYTLGLGAYYRWQPFKHNASFVNGITIAPSIRWWPNITSSLENNQLIYLNLKTNRQEVHHPNNIGFSNSPFFANVSVGYTL